MGAIADLATLLRFYANKHDSAFVSEREFCDYLRKYAEHHIAEQPELSKYLDNTKEAVARELPALQSSRQVYVLEQSGGRETIIVIAYFTVKFAERFKEMESNDQISFPTVTDLPRQVPTEAIPRKRDSDIIPALMQKQNLKSPALYCIILAHDAPPVMFPECIPVSALINAALSKISTRLKKEESRDYFYKKISGTNAGRELSVKNFFDKVVKNPKEVLSAQEVTGDTFYYWNQLCYFFKKDFEKVKDLSQEDVNILQSVAISEQFILVLKDKYQKERAKEEALKALTEALARPPYFFTMQTIMRMTDSKGNVLLGKYSEEDLQNRLRALSTESEGNNLPRLLVFKIESGARYFVWKAKVFALILRLCNEARDEVERRLTDKWFAAIDSYQKLPEMQDHAKFEDALRGEVESASPILFALLSSNFLPLLNVEFEASKETGGFHLFSDGHLLPYSKLLMLNSTSILREAKLRLPFWRSIPILSRIIALFVKKPAPSKQSAQKPKQSEAAEKSEAAKGKRSRRIALAANAKELEAAYVPAGSTIDRELDSYCRQWNVLITEDAHNRLTEDVNALIYSYMRRAVKTLNSQNLTADRIASIADTLLMSPNMKKITNQEALHMYVQLYILRLISNG